MNTKIVVSIGMSVRNNASTLRLALNSIIQQSMSDWELILIDDGSTDGTYEIAKSIADADRRIRLYRESISTGLASRMNQAISLSRGRYFARMDGDDVCYPDRFARQVAYLDANPEIDLLGTNCIVFGTDGGVIGVRNSPCVHTEICNHPWSGFYLAHPSWMGKMSWFKVNFYNSKAIKSQDYDLLLRTYKTSKFASLSEVLMGYREESLSKKKCFQTRIQTIKIQIYYAIADNAWSYLIYGVLGQICKAIVELLFIGTKYERRVLRHRAIKSTEAVEQKWKIVWSSLQI